MNSRLREKEGRKGPGLDLFLFKTGKTAEFRVPGTVYSVYLSAGTRRKGRRELIA
jgi:hypothetical protein